jgi:hypothetical protein
VKTAFWIAGGIVLVGLYVGYQLFGADIQIKLARDRGEGWKGSEPELRRKLTASLRENLKDFDLPKKVVPAMVGCMLPKVVAALNKTGCDYRYNKLWKSRADHDRDQTACLAKAGYTATEERLTIECAARHFPDSWAIYRRILVTQLASSAPPKLQRKQAWAACGADKMIAALNKTRCRPVELEPKAKINSVDSCVKREKLTPRMREIGRACATPTAPAATTNEPPKAR